MDRHEYAARLKEPSTWAGIAIILALFGVDLAPEQSQVIVQSGAGIGALLAIILGEKKSK